MRVCASQLMLLLVDTEAVEGALIKGYSLGLLFVSSWEFSGIQL